MLYENWLDYLFKLTCFNKEEQHRTLVIIISYGFRLTLSCINWNVNKKSSKGSGKKKREKGSKIMPIEYRECWRQHLMVVYQR